MKKTTISLGEKFHLFERDANKDKDSIYIEVSDIGECCFELWDIDNGQVSSRAKIKIPKHIWAKMMKDWTIYNSKDDNNTE